MKIQNEKTKKRFAVTAAAFLVMTVLVTGCSSRTHKETVTSPGSGNAVVVREETTTVDHDEHRGILGSTFHVVGEIIAFPFELIANVFRFIF